MVIFIAFLRKPSNPSNGAKGRLCSLTGCRLVSKKLTHCVKQESMQTFTEQLVQGSKSVRNRPLAQNLRSWSTEKFERQELQVTEAFCSLFDPSLRYRLHIRCTAMLPCSNSQCCSHEAMGTIKPQITPHSVLTADPARSRKSSSLNASE